DPKAEFCEELLDALALGVGDYFVKNGFKQIGVALSGGRDSLLVLLIAWRAVVRRFGAGKVAEVLRAFYMPTRYSSSTTRSAAEQIARDLGVPFKIVSVEDAFERELQAVAAMLGPGEQVTPVTMQNIQARVRGARMWNWSNSSGGLFLQTGNMSEKAVGYTTVGGDLEGSLSVISNVPKTVVMFLLEHLQAQHRFEGIRQVLAYPAGPSSPRTRRARRSSCPSRSSTPASRSTPARSLARRR